MFYETLAPNSVEFSRNSYWQRQGFNDLLLLSCEGDYRVLDNLISAPFPTKGWSRWYFKGPFQPGLFCDSLEAGKPCEVMKSLAGMILAINIWPLAKQFTYLRDK